MLSQDTVAIMDFEAIGITELEARALSQRVSSEIIRMEEFRVVEREQMERILNEQKFQYSGCVDISCAVKIGKIIGAQLIVVGSVSKIGNLYSIDSRLIDVQTSEAQESAQYTTTSTLEYLYTEGTTVIASQLCGVKEISAVPIYKHQYKSIPKNKFITKSLSYQTSDDWISVGLGLLSSLNSDFHNMPIISIQAPKVMFVPEHYRDNFSVQVKFGYLSNSEYRYSGAEFDIIYNYSGQINNGLSGINIGVGILMLNQTEKSSTSLSQMDSNSSKGLHLKSGLKMMVWENIAIELGFGRVFILGVPSINSNIFTGYSNTGELNLQYYMKLK